MKRTLILSLALLMGACQHTPVTAPAAFTLKQLNELSGLAPMSDGRYVALNDSGNAALLFLLSETLAPEQVIVTPLQNRDWEDMAYADLPDGRHLVVGDTGDNLLRHPLSTLYIFDQSALTATATPDPTETITFRFARGPVNCEAFFYAAQEQRFYFFSKSRGDADIYTLDWIPGNAAPVAKDLYPLRLQPASSASGLFAALTGINPETPTGAAVSVDGLSLAVLTYRSVWLWQKAPQESWAAVLKTSPRKLLTHQLPQAEAISFSQDEQQLLIGSEGEQAHLKLIDLPD